jgi:hypothetical protein
VSLGATLPERLTATPAASPRARIAARVRALGVTVPALVISRGVILVAGIVGSLTLTVHARPDTLRQSQALGSVGHLMAASVDRFDSTYYLDIAAHGYGGMSSRLTAFFPVYPGLIRAVAVVTRSPVVAGALISLVSFLVALTLLHRLAELELGRPAAEATTLLLCFAPLSFFFSAIYTESLFLALSVGTFYAARTDRLRLACVLAAAAALTRPTGFLLLGPLLVIAHRSGETRRRLAWLALVPAVVIGWMGVTALLGYGPMAEFHAEHTLWHRLTMFPLEGLIVSLLAMVKGISSIAAGGTVFHPGITGPFRPYAQDVILGAILILCLMTLEFCRRRMAPEYAVYAALVLLMCLASPEQGEPLWCFDRFALTIFPLWMAAGAFLARRRGLLACVLVVGVAGLVFYTMQFSSWAFVA